MKNTTYSRQTPTFEEAIELTIMKNKTNREKNQIFATVPGHDDNFAVVDIDTAIDLGLGYVVATSHLHHFDNPWKAYAAAISDLNKPK